MAGKQHWASHDGWGQQPYVPAPQFAAVAVPEGPYIPASATSSGTAKRVLIVILLSLECVEFVGDWRGPWGPGRAFRSVKGGVGGRTRTCVSGVQSTPAPGGRPDGRGFSRFAY